MSDVVAKVKEKCSVMTVTNEEVGGEVSRPVSSRDQNEKHCDTTQQQQKQVKAEVEVKDKCKKKENKK